MMMLKEEIDRRHFLKMVVAGGSALIGTMLSIPAIGFILSPLFTKQQLTWSTVGVIDDIPYGIPTPRIVELVTGSGWEAKPVARIVYVVRHENGDVLALSNICTHMQCDVHWDQSLLQFLCPCHGGLYNADGNNIGGPPPQPLPQWVHRTSINAQGQTVLEVANQLSEHI